MDAQRSDLVRSPAARPRSARRPFAPPRYLQQGAAVVAVTGGAFSLVGAAAPPVAAPAALTLDAVAQATPADVPLLAPSVEPVEPEPDVVDASRLVEAVRFTEAQVTRLAAERAAAEQQAAQQRAAAQPAAATGAPDCGISTSGLGAVKAHVRSAAEFLGCLFGEPTMYGVAGRGGTSDHPSGKAVDFMVGRAAGDALADCALRNKAALGITYVIWRQRINFGSGWEAMEDRGGATANHMDHVHVSFGSAAGSKDPTGC